MKTIDEVFIVNRNLEKWVILEKYPNFKEYSMNIKPAKEGSAERFNILLILYNINRFELSNVLQFIKDYTISELFEKLKN
jgi:hypothetical protein